ncbi:lipoprotein insertase outer membrane protein LolB [Sphaerotilus sp.]|uniref:outer membrane lipoprotein LolB n=1 Tax=Sphaerotilus sp. TaxID=2093942 RepID=UPI00286E6949|nr:lipoprotein insertase outer membrane protein LolB [Sphaerotilus sp.]
MALASAMLAGCAMVVIPPTAAPDPLARSYAGRLAVKVEGDDARSFSAGFDLQGTDVRGQLALISPIGTQVGRAVWQPGSVLWQSADGDRRFDTLDALAEEMLGEAVPLAALFDWMAGRPWHALPSRPLSVADGGTETGFRQLGWNVQTGRVADGVIVAQRRLPAPTLTVRIKLDTP